jgi:3-deoxy-D-manno-octulosonic acid (KDO) 8-phosphate synthase
MVCERGTMFGYSDLIVDPRNFVLMRDAACPVTADITHALQQPAGRALEARAGSPLLCLTIGRWLLGRWLLCRWLSSAFS